MFETVQVVSCFTIHSTLGARAVFRISLTATHTTTILTPLRVAYMAILEKSIFQCILIYFENKSQIT